MSLLQLAEVMVIAIVVIKPQHLPKTLEHMRWLIRQGRKLSYQGLQAAALDDNMKKAEKADVMYQTPHIIPSRYSEGSPENNSE